jgi:hypothetical protein
VSAPRRARLGGRATKRAYCRHRRPPAAPDTRRQSSVQQGTVTVAGRGAGAQQNSFLLPRASPSVGLEVWRDEKHLVPGLDIFPKGWGSEVLILRFRAGLRPPTHPPDYFITCLEAS